MDTDEIVKLTKEGIAEILRAQKQPDDDYAGENRRQVPRWPFPGTIELRPVHGDGSKQWFGVIRNLNESGLGFSSDEAFIPDEQMEISFHLPEASFYGHGVVRYCKEIRGQYMVGIEFLFN